MSLPSVSVVMSVFDQASLVAASVESVLAQQGVELEFVIIDDGADPEVMRVVEPYTSDPRVRIFSQTNQGLTKALIRGCEHATHQYIARIDVGDLMLEDRLQKQAKLLDSNPGTGLVTSHVEIVTDEGYRLYMLELTAAELRSGMRSTEASKLITPFHASVMFRKSLYQSSGGYRDAFYFAQDCDLWARMSALADVAVIPQILTRGLFSVQGISGRHRNHQEALKAIVASANQLRPEQSDETLLQQAAQLRPVPGESSTVSSYAANYFIASCLSQRRSKHASEYWRRACRARPLNLFAWPRYVYSLTFTSND